MGSRATALRSRPAAAGAGAAGSLLAAIAAAALIAPGIIGFDDWSLVPAPPLGGSVRVEPNDSAHRAFGPVASATSAPVVLPPTAGAGPAGGRAGDSAGGGVTIDGVSSSGGGSSSAQAVTGTNARPPAECLCRAPALNESLARGTEGAGTTVGSGLEGFGTAAGDALARFSPALSGEAKRSGATAAERARETGKTAGEAIRRLPGPGPVPAAATPVRRVLP